ncbi:MAG: lipopolysaccharide biosynthesis protein [Candidatus Rokubacteria bacterium]|nr:lipopolysaccharide biosynthesis protein [Candidatus Rokubacteria bacterium]
MSSDLGARAVKSTAWYVANRAWTQGISWLVTIVVARLLTPADYGLFGMSMGVIAFLELFQQLGIGTAIVQRRDLTRPQVNALFWLYAGASLVVSLLAVALAPLAARFYGEPRLIGLINALGLVFLLNALGTVPYSLLTREIDFRRRSLAEALGALVSSAAAIGLAWGGAGVWALVGAHLASAVVRNISLMILCGWLPGLDASFRGVGEMLRFGLKVGSTLVVETLSGVANTALLGRILGPTALGYYSMARSLGRNPFHKLSTAAINQLSLPVFSRLQREDGPLRSYFLRISKYLAVIALPMQCGIALVAHDLVLVLLGDKWLPIVPIFQILTIGSLASVLSLPAPPLLTARGRPGRALHVSAAVALLTFPGYLIGTRWGLLGVAVTWAIIFTPLRCYLIGLALRELGLGPGPYLRNLLSSILATVAMIAAVLLVRAATPGIEGAIERLARDIAIGAASYVGVLLLHDRSFGHEMKTIAKTLVAGSRA